MSGCYVFHAVHMYLTAEIAEMKASKVANFTEEFLKHEDNKGFKFYTGTYTTYIINYNKHMCPLQDFQNGCCLVLFMNWYFHI